MLHMCFAIGLSFEGCCAGLARLNLRLKRLTTPLSLGSGWLSGEKGARTLVYALPGQMGMARKHERQLRSSRRETAMITPMSGVNCHQRFIPKLVRQPNQFVTSFDITSYMVTLPPFLNYCALSCFCYRRAV